LVAVVAGGELPGCGVQSPSTTLASAGFSRCADADLPLPEVNVPLTVGDTQLEADFLWRSARLIVEADGRYSHLTVTAFEKDRRRDQRLRLAGWEVIRCTWRQVLDDPEELGHTLRTLLSNVPGPPLPGG
jgi:hypothetical protein